MFYTKDANGEFVEIGEPVVLETVATDQMTNAFEELTFTFKMSKKDLDKLARVLLPNNWLKMHHYPKRRKVNVRTYH